MNYSSRSRLRYSEQDGTLTRTSTSSLIYSSNQLWQWHFNGVVYDRLGMQLLSLEFNLSSYILSKIIVQDYFVVKRYITYQYIHTYHSCFIP
jgi:hypothetical protein